MPDGLEGLRLYMEGQDSPRLIGFVPCQVHCSYKEMVINELQGRNEVRFVKLEIALVPNKVVGYVLIVFSLERSEPLKVGRLTFGSMAVAVDRYSVRI